MLKAFLKSESGATAIEYSLISALVSVVAISALDTMGGSLITMFTSASDAMVLAGTEQGSDLLAIDGKSGNLTPATR